MIHDTVDAAFTAAHNWLRLSHHSHINTVQHTKYQRMTDGKETLKQWCASNKLSEASLSADGATLSLESTTLDGKENISVSNGEGKEVQYSLASIFLQLLDPNQSLVKYRTACKKHSVKDAVKALDKPLVVGYFLEGTAAAAAEPAAAEAAPVEAAKEKEAPPADRKRGRDEKTSKDKHGRKDKKRSSSSKDRSSKDKHDKAKKNRGLVTNEQLFSNLNVVVDKRTGGQADEAEQTEAAADDQKVIEEPKSEEFEAIRKALSTDGFQVTPEMLEKYKETTEAIVAHEIPVGDSASVLRASSVGANLTRVLNIFMEAVNPTKAQKKAAANAPSKKAARPYLVGKKPIILLPKGMTAPVTILNGYDFFADARFIPRDAMMKDKTLQANSKKTTLTHKMAGVGLVEYELLDNPRKLTTREDWERVVAVLVLGHKWQFKDWPGKYSDPVQLFANTFGFYIGSEGEKISADLEGWSCKRAVLHRDKRGLDSVTHASFWNSLDEWIKIHRPELLPRPDI